MNTDIQLFNVLLEKQLRGNYHFHIHYDRSVPSTSLRLWKKRGYHPIPVGVAHVRFDETSDKKYTFPAFFEVI